MFRRFVLSSIRVTVFFTATATSTWAQSYSPMYSPLSTQNLNYVCLDQYGYRIPYAYFTFRTQYYQFTNAHFHDDPSHLASPGIHAKHAFLESLCRDARLS